MAAALTSRGSAPALVALIAILSCYSAFAGNTLQPDPQQTATGSAAKNATLPVPKVFEGLLHRLASGLNEAFKPDPLDFPPPQRTPQTELAMIAMSVNTLVEYPYIKDKDTPLALPGCEGPDAVVKGVGGEVGFAGCEWAIFTTTVYGPKPRKIIFLSFRSTELGGFQDWHANLEGDIVPLNVQGPPAAGKESGACADCGGVAKGFQRYYQQGRAAIHAGLIAAKAANKDAEFVFTGHSLGAALALIATVDILHNKVLESKELRTLVFGMPSPGDALFKKKLDLLLPADRLTAFATRIPVKGPELLTVDAIALPMIGRAVMSPLHFLYPVKYKSGPLRTWEVHQRWRIREGLARFEQVYGKDLCKAPAPGKPPRPPSEPRKVCWKGNEKDSTKWSFFDVDPVRKCKRANLLATCSKHGDCSPVEDAAKACKDLCICGTSGINECECVKAVTGNPDILCDAILYIGTATWRPVF